MNVGVATTNPLNNQIHNEPVHLLKEETSSDDAWSLANTIANSIKNIGFGAAIALISLPVRAGITLSVHKADFLPKTSISEMVKSSPLLNAGYLMSECFGSVNEYMFTEMEKLLIDRIPAEFLSNGICVPIYEEIVFRALIQDVMLTRIPKYVVRKILPGKETTLDSKVAKAVRIALTAFAFSTVGHAYNAKFLPDELLKAQMINTLIMGIGLGLIKESNAGLLGSIGCHVFNNIIATYIKHYV